MKGLCVKGGAEIDLAWAEGKLTGCVLHAKARLHTKIRYGEKVKPVDLQPGEVMQFTVSDF